MADAHARAETDEDGQSGGGAEPDNLSAVELSNGPVRNVLDRPSATQSLPALS